MRTMRCSVMQWHVRSAALRVYAKRVGSVDPQMSHAVVTATVIDSVPLRYVTKVSPPTHLGLLMAVKWQAPMQC
jgi:hypothetical protein